MSVLKKILLSCVVPLLSVQALRAQQVFTTDVYVQSSLCVGLDCVVPESFGFATIKLKENNTQIKFEDSSTGTFPAMDWTIGANETNNNGKNLFFIDDEVSRIVTIEGGAPANSLYVHPTGNVSLGSNTQNGKLYVNGSLVVNGNITALSDRRIKTNIADLQYGLDAVMRLSAKQYEYIQDGRFNLDLEQGLQLGLIAQEVEAVIPEIVKHDFQVSDSEGQPGFMKSVSYVELIPVLINAIQEQQDLIRQKDLEIAEIRSQLTALTQRVDQLLVR